MVVWWLSSWLAEKEVCGLIPGLTASILEIGYLLLSSHIMAEILKRKSSIQPTNLNESHENKVSQNF